MLVCRDYGRHFGAKPHAKLVPLSPGWVLGTMFGALSSRSTGSASAAGRATPSVHRTRRSREGRGLGKPSGQRQSSPVHRLRQVTPFKGARCPLRVVISTTCTRSFWEASECHASAARARPSRRRSWGTGREHPRLEAVWSP